MLSKPILNGACWSLSRRGMLKAGLAPMVAPCAAAYGTNAAGRSRDAAAAPLEGCDPSQLGLAISADGKTAYAAFGSSDEILVVDLTRGVVRSSIPMAAAGVMLRSHQAVLSADGRLLFVVNHGTANVAVIDTAQERLKQVLPLNGTYGDCLAAPPRGQTSGAGKVYIALGNGLAIVDCGDLTYRILEVRGVVFDSIALSPSRPNLLFNVGGQAGRGYLQAVNLDSGTLERQAILSAEAADPNGNVNRLVLESGGKVAYLGWNWMVNGGGSGNLTAFDVSALQRIATRPVEDGVSDIAVHPETGKVYAVGFWNGLEAGRVPGRLYITECEPSTLAITRRLPVSPSNNVASIRLDPLNPGFAYMTETFLDLLRKVDLATGAEVMRVRFFAGRRMPSAITAGGTTAYIASSRSPLVHKLDLDTGRLAGSFTLPGRTGASGCEHYEGKLYLTGGNTVDVIDSGDGALLLRRQVPDGLSLSPKVTFFRGRLAAAAALPGRDPDRIVVLDAGTLDLLGTVELESPLMGRIGGATASPDGSKLYVQHGLLFKLAVLQVLDSATLRVLKRIEPPTAVGYGGDGDFGAFDEVGRIAYLGGSASVYRVHMDTDEYLGRLDMNDLYREMGRENGWAPNAIRGMHLSEGNARLLITSWSGSCVFSYDLRNRKWVQKVVRGGLYPAASAASPDGKSLYVVNAKSDTVARIDTASATLLEVTPLGGPAAQLDPSCLLNGASLQPAQVVPGCVMAIVDSPGAPFPGELGPPLLTPARLDASGRVASELAGTRVLFDGVAAPILSAYAAQIRVVVPYGVAGKPRVSVQVVSQGEETVPVECGVAAAWPGIFTADGSGQGQAAALNEDGTPNGPANPAAKGSTVTVYATGAGITEPPGVDGEIGIEGPARPVLPAGVWLQGLEAEVVSVGAAPGKVSGILQVRIRLPFEIPSDPRVPIAMMVGDSPPSQDGVTVAVA